MVSYQRLCFLCCLDCSYFLVFSYCSFTKAPGACALVCPPADGFIEYKYGGDGSCYTEVQAYPSWDEVYPGCARTSAYLPIVLNAFQNTALQNKTYKGGYYGEKLVGMWLGMTCTGFLATSCIWDDGTPLTSTSYSNFELGYPNATIGPCVYQDVKTGRWRSQVCSPVASLSPSGGYLGAFCKYTPTNNVPMCSARTNNMPYYPLNEYPNYFRGYCYDTYGTNNIDDAEKVCTSNCGHIISIHSEGENSFVRDVLLAAGGSVAYSCWPKTSGFLGIRGNSSQWYDGTPTDYTNYVIPPVMDPNSCAFMAVNSTPGFCSPPDDRSLYPSGNWYTGDCYQLQTKYLLCKKPLLNSCDKPFVPFPMKSPPVCSGPQHLGAKGTVYAPGYPYYPYGQQPNTCEYIQKVDKGHPSMNVWYETTSNFLPNVTISKFDFYSSEDPNDTPFYSFDGYPYFLPPVVSPTNILRAVYTTIGDPANEYDWGWMDYSIKN